MQPHVLVTRCWYATDYWRTGNRGNRLFTTAYEIIDIWVAVLQLLFPLPYGLVLTYHIIVVVLCLFILWLTHFTPLWTHMVNFLPAIMCYTVSERAWWNFKTHQYNINVLSEEEFATFECKLNVLWIYKIENNLRFWVWFLEIRHWQGAAGSKVPCAYKWLTCKF